MKEVLIAFDGRSHTVTQWARIVGLDPETLRRRFQYGWSAEKAISTPVQRYTKHETRVSRFVTKLPNGKFEYRYRLVAERALGYPLPKGVEIHHINKDAKDDANHNLVICENAAYHRLLHQRQRIIAAGGDPATQLFCGFCKRVLPFDAFNLRKASTHSRSNKCRECSKEAFKQWWENGGREQSKTEAKREYQKKYWHERAKVREQLKPGRTEMSFQSYKITRF